MISIPNQNKKHSVSPIDLLGTINYGRNINLDEEGYIKLSPRAVSIQSQASYANSGLPLAFGRKNTGNYIVPNTQFAMTQNRTKGYWVVLSETQITLNADVGTNAPVLTSDSHGKWFHNLWHVTTDTDLWTKATIDDTATYTEVTDGTPANLTTGKAHFLEVFRNKNALCVTDGNSVIMYTESGGTYTVAQTLVLPSDFEAIGLSYSNNQMGIICVLSDTNSGQNQDAYFFVWDGASATASKGVPIGSDKAVAIASYMGSWVILTRTGELLYWTGGGFTKLASFPFSYQSAFWGKSFTREVLGDAMQVDGEVIYINVNGILNANGKNYETYLPSSPGGVWCYDPKIGLYHRASPSISPACILKVAQADVNTTTNIMTITALAGPDVSTIPSTGSPVKYIYDRASLIGGLNTPTVYYCIKLSASTFALASTKALALAGTKIDLTSTGAANNYFLALETYDYGAQMATTSGGMAMFDVNSETYRDLILGAELRDFDGTGDSNHVNVLVPGFENRGYFVTPKMQSAQIEDRAQRVIVKYRTLKTNDSIVVKVKSEDVLGLPVSTPQARTTGVNQCSWTAANAFSTTADFSDALTAYTAGKELECEVIAGAGAGTLTKISSISYGGGTYAVQLAEDVDGAAASRYCDVVVDNWKYLGTITSADVDGYKQFNVDSSAPWHKFKVELRGTETTVESLQVVNKVQKEAA